MAVVELGVGEFLLLHGEAESVPRHGFIGGGGDLHADEGDGATGFLSRGAQALEEAVAGFLPAHAAQGFESGHEGFERLLVLGVAGQDMGRRHQCMRSMALRCRRVVSMSPGTMPRRQ
jgi:hypothetical protein